MGSVSSFSIRFQESDKPAGSFRWDKFVRSSLASSMAGFIKGGRFGLLSTCSSACVVSTVFVYTSDTRISSLGDLYQSIGVKQTSPFSNVNTSCTLSPSTNFSVTSDATHPSVGSGCQARVPTS